jgi:hypothetical protein
LFIILTLPGCSFLAGKPEAKDFSKAGMTITLTDEFYEKEMRSYTVCYDSTNIAVFALKEEFTLLQGLENYSLSDYCKLVINNNGKDCSVQEDNDLTYFVLDYTANGKNYKYFCPVFKGTDAFWLVQFSCVSDDYDEYLDDFIKWAKSIKFSADSTTQPDVSST